VDEADLRGIGKYGEGKKVVIYHTLYIIKGGAVYEQKRFDEQKNGSEAV